MSSFEKIEFRFPDSEGELVDLWFWDWAHGRDVTGTLMQDGTVKCDVRGSDDETETISAIDFFKRIKASLDARDEQYKPQ